jgi:hypothetical protein
MVSKKDVERMMKVGAFTSIDPYPHAIDARRPLTSNTTAIVVEK